MMDQETADRHERGEHDEGLIQRLAKIMDPQYQEAYMREQRRQYSQRIGLKDEPDKHQQVTLESTTQSPVTANHGPERDTTQAPQTNNSKLAEKKIHQIVSTRLGYEGHNSRVRRAIGIPEVRNFSPFLMLDHFSISAEAGFPDHPHRGQETITYVLQGSLDHEDFTGARGTLDKGDLQFMTAGRGVVHAEMPHVVTPEEQAAAAAVDDYTPMGSGHDVEGLQLWVDLPVNLKQCEPRYRDLRAAEIPTARVGNGNDSFVKVISGEAYGVLSVQDLAYTPVWMLDYVIQPPPSDEDSTPLVVDQQIPAGFNSFVYVISGSNITIANHTVGPHTTVFFTANRANPELIRITVPPNQVQPSDDKNPLLQNKKKKTRVLIVAGKILDQPIVQHGPFVEISRDRIIKAFNDYQTFTNGFERAWGWASHIGRRLMV
ncbi:hypothetical protein D0Z00_001379 [Geotrichum galactomycetum]|uniref:Uncharacterized protein n=1 Tax=Geotrichum galactomycetum TaxID=27317 RepID=A0ACB6V795_9ASCO|nr:hypothetical protein D0Z00_001379 [Geotrichum candidum]